MATGRTVLIFISCVLCSTLRSTTSQDPAVTAETVRNITVSPATSTHANESNESPPTTTVKDAGKSESPSPNKTLESTAESGTVPTPTSTHAKESNESQPNTTVKDAGKSGTVPTPISTHANESKAPVGFSTTTVTQTVEAQNASDTKKTSTDSALGSPENNNASATTMVPKSTQTDASDIKKTDIKAGSDSMHELPDAPDNKKYLWILLPVGVAVVAIAMYIRSKFFKVHHHPETTDNGTENASFQRTESNKDGVMLLGVKTSGTEEAAAAK